MLEDKTIAVSHGLRGRIEACRNKLEFANTRQTAIDWMAEADRLLMLVFYSRSVDVVLPEREEGEPYWSAELDADFDQRLEWAEAKGFNRAIDKVKELNQ